MPLNVGKGSNSTVPSDFTEYLPWPAMTSDSTGCVDVSRRTLPGFSAAPVGPGLSFARTAATTERPCNVVIVSGFATGGPGAATETVSSARAAVPFLSST